MNVWIAGYVALEWVLRLLMAVVIILRQRRPNSALAWLLLVMMMPVVGTILYVIFGESGLGKKRLHRYRADLGIARHTTDEALDPKLREKQRLLEGVTQRLGAMAARGGNDVEFLVENDVFVSKLLADINAAQHHIHMLYFIFEDDSVGKQVVEALVKARGRGVEVRVLADGAGSFSFFLGPDQTLIDAGAEVHDYLPVNPLRRKLIRFDLRNHRKLTLIDGKIAFTGSHNLVRDDVGLSSRAKRKGATWQDLTARIVGPSVTGLQQVFADDWRFETKKELKGAAYFPEQPLAGTIPVQVVPSGPHQEDALLRDCLVEALHTARRRVILSTPYFVPDESFMAALRLAALRGCEVDLIVPLKSDKRMCDLVARSHFTELMHAGVRIHLHTKGVLHSKTMTVDDEIALVTSANLDIRSFYLNFELGVLLFERDATARLRFCQTKYLEDSQRVNSELWKGRSSWRRFVERAAGLWSPVL